MLTVVSANVDIANQEIVEMAREVDPSGERTLGVLTKPDLVDKGAENKVIDLIEGRNLKMRLGWIVVRNLGQKELQEGGVDRDIAEEDFRHTHPWNTIGEEKFGIKALRSRLQETVTTNARQAFASVRAEINKKLRERQDNLAGLGEERETPEQQSRYLLKVMNSFEGITRHALSTNYSSNDHFDEDEELRLATRIVNRNDEFSNDMALWGHEYDFAIDKTHGSTAEPHHTDIKDEYQFESRKLAVLPDLEDILHLEEGGSLCKPRGDDIYAWIEKQYRSSRGFEIGTFNCTLLSTVMKQQSRKWKSIAYGYISDIIIMTHTFTLKALSLACPDVRVCQNLLSVLMDQLVERYTSAIDKVKFLLFVERSGTPMTLNHYLNDNLEKSRQKRFISDIGEKSLDGCNHGRVVRVDDLATQHHMSNEAHTVRDIHDILESYYKVARKRFVDNICMQAVDYNLVTGPNTPMHLFSSSLVSSFTKEQLDEIAGEETALKRRRRQLAKEIEDLKQARKILF
ncbi:hypothetical protein DTO212C5_4338 [Paecilomyces variotii]|nr:hypothetical protein DTO212C5_4338 [Paecilomyces variotii]